MSEESYGVPLGVSGGGGKAFSAEEAGFFARKSLFSLHFDSDLVFVN